MKEYNHAKIERKWQQEWEKKKIYFASSKSKKPKFYSLIEFPYPSGDGLHVGHPRPYIGMDVISRKRRMQGHNVLFPIGWDAFGLPTENYAIKTGKQPKVITKKNTDTFRRQIKSLGISFDWSREINTTDPSYYKWTQWLFLQFFKKGLAYKAKSEINWCPKDKIGLANEEVIDGKCERCGTVCEKKEKEQWMLGITKYADRLDKDLNLVDYPERVKLSQRNWIGKSEGSEIDFPVLASSSNFIKVFTTRADTLFGVTYVVLAPEHPLVKSLLNKVENKKEVEKYIDNVRKKSDLERTENKEKTGVELKGVKAINPAYGGASPANNEVYPAEGGEIPVWVADYVLPNYGTGAVMAVPQHDTRDREFAEKYNLPIVDKPLVNAVEITEKVGGKMVTKFKLRDWVFSRQRYWGEPIPVINCGKCGLVPVPDKDLPVKLPEVKSYKPTDTGESPLAAISKWVNTKCPKCGGKAKRETDTMPNWAGSSWYYLRYTDTKNKKEFASKENLKYWLGNKAQSGGVDWYNGGMEHTTLHLLYSRFWHKFLYDLKLVPTIEPYKKRTSHGMILGAGGVKMSKSLGNVVNPDEIVKLYGADTLRVYEMFMGPFEDTAVWNTDSIIGARRFIEKVWRIEQSISASSNFSSLRPSSEYASGTLGKLKIERSSNSTLVKLLHKTIKKVSEDIEVMHFNTAISAMMILATEMEKAEQVSIDDYKKFLQILAPFAPHVAQDIWNSLGEKKDINISDWPKYDEALIKDDAIKIAVQVNGKVRAEIIINTNEDEEEIRRKAQKDESIVKFISGKEIKKIIYVKNRLVNIVV
ncbi:MAG: class I tRNA ligase family protein [bacterium]